MFLHDALAWLTMRIRPELAATLAAVVDEGTLDAAARRLHLTPSAVSQRIKALEQQLGRVLLVRAKPARPTEAGEASCGWPASWRCCEHDARRRRWALDEARGPRHHHAARRQRRLAGHLVPARRWRGCREPAPVVFDLHRDDQDFTAGLLESGTVMAAVTSQSTPVAGLPGAARSACCATRPSRRPGYVARWLPDGADAAALATAPFVDFDRRDDLQTEWLRARGVPLDVRRAALRAGIARLRGRRSALGLGWGMLPRMQSADALADGEPRPARRTADLRRAVLAAVEPALAAAGPRSPTRSPPRPHACSRGEPPRRAQSSLTRSTTLPRVWPCSISRGRPAASSRSNTRSM